jgi:hypothetical protein
MPDSMMPPAAAALPPVRLSRLRGEFLDPALEQAFRVSTMHRAVVPSSAPVC